MSNANSAEAGNAENGGDGIDIDSAVNVNVNSSSSSSSKKSPTPKSPPLKKPSYYIDSFHEHFFPHPDDIDSANDVAATATESQSQPSPPPRPRKKLSLFQRYATSMARHPWKHLLTAFVLAVILSFVGLRFGNFEVAIDNAGWWSRGTTVANRATQGMLVNMNRYDLFTDESGDVWEELQTVVQPNWQQPEEDEEEDADPLLESVCSGDWYGSSEMISPRNSNLFPIWKTNDADESEPEMSMLDADSMYDVCMAEQNTLAALEDQDSCYKCTTETDSGSEGNKKCIQPYSLVLMARFHLTGNDISQLHTLADTISCDTLRSLWTTNVQQSFTISLKTCVNWSVRMNSGNNNGTITIQDTTITISDPCPFPIKFVPSVVDELFPMSDRATVRYSSSYFATKDDKDTVEEMYDSNEDNMFDRSDGTPIVGVYDTNDEDFSGLYSDAIVGRDMALAVGSAGVTVIAMLVHTKSPFLTLMGLFQIILSFPLAYFVYYFIGGLVFFPFLNFIGIFVVFALGADDVFVAVDKWKNARSELPHGTTEQVAALALPDAAYAMLLTSLTTAVAFFATALSPVGPIVCFAVFCGLLITFDYLMNIFLVFPALCLYDKWVLAGSKNCCVNFDWCCRRKEDPVDEEELAAASKPKDEEDQPQEDEGVNTEANIETGKAEGQSNSASMIRTNDDEEERDELVEVMHQSLIHRILDGYYNILHKFRWLVLLAVAAALIACSIIAAQLRLPSTSEVALLPESNEYQKHLTWKQKLLAATLAKEKGSEALLTWGVTPADTGDHLNPDSWTTLVLDETFEPESQASQSYMLNFCDRLFDKFGKVEDDYVCPMNDFDEWLQEQSASESPTDEYTQNCNEESQVPVASEVFHPCIIAWSKLHDKTSVLQTDERVRIMNLRTKSNVLYDSPFDKLKTEVDAYEEWLENERNSAPSGNNKVFNSDLVSGFCLYFEQYLFSLLAN